ncbi:MAG: hypothetical protein OEY93_05095, partial [Anaerolineae bacterium]|nr:hypothetical protein [Anaerolineae bacterium]
MTGTITIILINLVIALAEFLIAGITLLTNPKSRENRAISFLLALFGTASLSIGLVAGALSGEEKLPWFLVQSGSIYAISAVTFYVSLVILRPNVANKKWISIPTWIFILLPIAAVAVDSLAITQPLFISIQEVI